MDPTAVEAARHGPGEGRGGGRWGAGMDPVKVGEAVNEALAWTRSGSVRHRA
jgi:hypothetical protein